MNMKNARKYLFAFILLGLFFAATTYAATVLRVRQGGTGATTFGSNGIILGHGTGPLTASTITIDSSARVYGLNELHGSTGGVLQIAGDVIAYPDTGLYFKISNPTTAYAVSLDTSLLSNHRIQSFPDQAGTFLLERRSNVNVSTALSDVDSNKVFYNTGAGASVTYTLPEAVPGYSYTFVVTEANPMVVQLPSGLSTIKFSTTNGTDVTGYISSNVIGSTVTLYSLEKNVYTARSITGKWTVAI